MSADFVVQPARRLAGTFAVPADKSISHRALILAALADQTTRVCILDSEDVRATMRALQALGVEIKAKVNTEQYLVAEVRGIGEAGFQAPQAAVLNLGNSGTSMRLLAGLLAGRNLSVTLTGDDSLRRRPMARVIEPLRRMGAKIEAAAGGRPPLHIRPAGELNGIHYRLPVSSAQVKSAILLAGLTAKGRTTVVESLRDRSRDHTETMLRPYTGAMLQIEDDEAGDLRQISMQPMPDAKKRWISEGLPAPGDFSSAAFGLIAAALCPDRQARVEIPAVGINPTRAGLLLCLRQMGVQVKRCNKTEVAGEPVARLEIAPPARLFGCEAPLPGGGLADMIDEIPALAMAMACADGKSVVSGAAELRHKESDRIAGICRGLTALGVQVEERPDGFSINGIGSAGKLCAETAAQVDSAGDHRIAMAFSCLAPRLSAPVRIKNCDAVATSFPDFVSAMGGIQLRIKVEQAADG